MSKPTATRDALLQTGLDLIHQVLLDKAIPEELRLKLVDWRHDVEIILNGETSDEI